jgi:hypothetical protein
MKPKANFVRQKNRKHDSSMKTRSFRLANEKRQRGKYPMLAEKIVEMSDIILEILDLRFAQQTRNPEIEAKAKKQKKQIIYVFNKSDLIDKRKIDADYLSSLTPKVFVSCTQRKGIKELRNKIKYLARQVHNPVDQALGKVTVGVVGYPNTGKSSVINILAGKTATGVGADAGFTKGIIKVKLTPEINLLDSPGIIAEGDYSTSDVNSISRNTLVGAKSYSQVRNPELAVAHLTRDYPAVFDKFYNLESNGDSEILIEKLGRKRNLLKKGNEIDEDKTARLILKDWQEGRIRL